jgi:hypothetical protein
MMTVSYMRAATKDAETAPESTTASVRGDDTTNPTVSAVTPDGRPCVLTFYGGSDDTASCWVPRFGDERSERLSWSTLRARGWATWARGEHAKLRAYEAKR